MFCSYLFLTFCWHVVKPGTVEHGTTEQWNTEFRNTKFRTVKPGTLNSKHWIRNGKNPEHQIWNGKTRNTKFGTLIYGTTIGFSHQYNSIYLSYIFSIIDSIYLTVIPVNCAPIEMFTTNF